MFETPEFRQLLIDTIGSETPDSRRIADYLQRLAVANEEGDLPFLRGYNVETAYQVARQSVTSLLGLAVEYSRERGEREATLEDVQKAYQVRFCGFWPFCK